MRLTNLVPVLVAGVCTSALLAAPPVVSFESLVDGPAWEGAAITDQFWDSHGIRFRNTEPGQQMMLAKVGAPVRAFSGYLGSADEPLPGARVGEFFLTDSHFGTGPRPGPFVLEYRWPTSRISGEFLDVTGQEVWQAEAFDAAGASRGLVQIWPTLLAGSAIAWSLETDSAVITKVVVTFTGIAPPGGVTFALDNIGGSEPECLADLNFDGQVDFSDFLVFVDAYSQGSLVADFNRDGLIDFQDYLEFLSRYDAGC